MIIWFPISLLTELLDALPGKRRREEEKEDDDDASEDSIDDEDGLEVIAAYHSAYGVKIVGTKCTISTIAHMHTPTLAKQNAGFFGFCHEFDSIMPIKLMNY